MIINHNLPAMNTFRQLSINNSNTSKSLEKLSSGLRINRAGDDAAGLAISEKMRSQIRGLDQASSNAQDGISLIQTAEGALQEVHSMLQRMKELAVQAANDTNTTYDRGEIQKEINQLTSEINRIGNTTEFNTMKLLNGSKDSIINGPASTSVDKTLTLGTTFTIGTSRGVTPTGAGITLTDGKITIGEGALANLDLGTGATITLSWEDDALGTGIAGLRIHVEATVGDNPTPEQLKAVGAAGNNFVLDDVVGVGSDGRINFENWGLKFSIAAEDVAKLADGDGLEISLATAFGSSAINYDARGDVSVSNSWKDNKVGAIATGVKFAAGYDYASVTISANGLNGASGKIYIKAENADGTLLVDDEIDLATTLTIGQTLSYNNFGITFNLTFPNGGGASAADDTFEIFFTSDPNFAASNPNVNSNFFATKKTTVTTAGSGTTTYDNSQTLTFQIGANAGQGMVAGIADMRSLALGISSQAAGSSVDLTQFDSTLVKNTGVTANGQYVYESRYAQFVVFRNVNNGSDNVDVEYALDVSSYDNATAAITIYDQAINKVSSERSKLGAMQNRLEHTIANLDNTSENLQAAESRIRDVNMAKEMMAFQKNSILAQAATAMLAQANQQPQNVLQLLR